jgi:hypothetical protein
VGCLPDEKPAGACGGDLGRIAKDHLAIRRTVKEREQDAGIASQPVEPGDDQRGVLPTACVQCTGQRWPIASLTALNLGILPDQLPIAAVQIFGDGNMLRLQPEHGTSLSARAGPKISDEEFA